MYVVDVRKDNKVQRKVFLHMIKTAGISVHKGLNKAEHRIQFNQRHSHISMLPDKYCELPRYMILRKPEDWYVSFYNFFLPVEGFFSFMLRDNDGIAVDINEFILRATNMKNFFFKHQIKTEILNAILNEQDTLHFMLTFFTEQITSETYMNYDFSIFDWFFRGNGGENAKLFTMDRKGILELEKEFNIKMAKENSTVTHPDYKKVQVKDISPEMLQLIRDVDKKYYDMFEDITKKQ